jgi:hypothetical protein
MSTQRTSPAAGARTGLGDVLSIGSDSPVSKPKTHVAQAGIIAPFPPECRLRLVERQPLPRLSVRIAAADGRMPFGRSRNFRLREQDLAELLAVAARLEARR